MTVTPLSRTAARRIARAVVIAELHRLRTTASPRGHGDDWPDTLPIGDEGLGLDSIEQLGALGALAETFGLDDAQLGTESPRTVGDWIDWIMRRQATGDGRLVVRTSGSTGEPSTCVHAMTDLIGEAHFLATQVTGRRRVVAMVPAHHLYGIIWTALLPAVLDIPVVVRAIGAPLGLSAGDLVVAVPDQWDAMSRLVRGFTDDVVGVSSAGPLDDGLAAELLAGGLRRLVDIDGSSETSGIAIRAAPATAYELLPRWSLVQNGDDDWQLRDDRGGRHALPDHIERIGDRCLRPIGRRDGAVQVGGHNVWPGRVTDVLRGIDGVADAAVRLHATGRLKAFIVPEPGGDPAALSAHVEQMIVDRLAGPERPKSLRFGTALPRNGMGKLEDWT